QQPLSQSELAQELGGQPTAGQIRSRRICHLLAALRQSKSLRGLSSQLQIFFHCFVQTWQ
ncbi:hypothetical protein, partial [Acinetobacter baumannii]|uniref:hypothetical protein n=1 Tax=Acinetobacter baumannii TaxID=470 RepID=UPI00227829A8